MSSIIEFIGPAGVGKSSIYKSLIRQNNKKSIFASIQEFYPKISKPQSGSLDNLILQARKILRRPLYDAKKMRQAGYKFQSKNREFIELCWDLINKYQKTDHFGNDNRFTTANNLFNYFSKFQAASDCRKPHLCLTDELLLHTIVQLTNENYLNQEIIMFSELVPLPLGIINCNAAPEVIANRSLTRKTIHSQSGRTFQELSIIAESERNKIDLMADTLKRRKVKVLKVDTTNSIELNTNIINDFIVNLTMEAS